MTGDEDQWAPRHPRAKAPVGNSSLVYYMIRSNEKREPRMRGLTRYFARNFFSHSRCFFLFPIPPVKSLPRLRSSGRGHPSKANRSLGNGIRCSRCSWLGCEETNRFLDFPVTTNRGLSILGSVGRSLLTTTYHPGSPGRLLMPSLVINYSALLSESLSSAGWSLRYNTHCFPSRYPNVSLHAAVQRHGSVGSLPPTLGTPCLSGFGRAERTEINKIKINPNNADDRPPFEAFSCGGPAFTNQSLFPFSFSFLFLLFSFFPFQSAFDCLKMGYFLPVMKQNPEAQCSAESGEVDQTDRPRARAPFQDDTSEP
ncbi:hypothetical protein BDW75DRAFT_2130 [Aspergillus navahoensis]